MDCGGKTRRQRTRIYPARGAFAPGHFFCYNISMRDYVESNNGLSTEGGKDYPHKCIEFRSPQEGIVNVYAKNKGDCAAVEEKARQIMLENSTDGTENNIFESSSAPELMYTAIGFAIAAIICIITGLIMNAINKKKQANNS